MRVMPTLGEPRRTPHPGLLAAFSLLFGILGGIVYYHLHPEALPLHTTTLARAEPQPVVAPLPLPAVQAAPAPAPAPAADPALAKAGLAKVAITVDGPMEKALVDQLGQDTGAALGQVIGRALVWWMSVPADLRKGDKLEVLYEPRAGEEPVLHALRYTSAKGGQEYRAYRYQAQGEKYPRFYMPDGNELELRLADAPIDDYEQITSLIKDGRHHKGVDFRTPVGTPVKAPFSGTITRRNWNWRGNGNCLEITLDGGERQAIFLHLDVLPPERHVGEQVQKGEVLAHSGNSGHSFAPHLHYQLMQGEEKVLDPFRIHQTFRRHLAAASRPGLDAEVSRLDALFGGRAG